MKVFGLQLNVWDFDLAKSFYCDALGFEVENESFLPEILHLNKDGFRIMLFKIEEVLEAESFPHFLIDLETNDLEGETERLSKMDVTFVSDGIQSHPIVDYIEILDPFKNMINIIQLRNK